MTIRPNDMVAWTWGNGLAEGKVTEVRAEPTEITSNGKKIKRNGTADNPALIIQHASGHPVLKLKSEVQKTDKGSDG